MDEKIKVQIPRIGSKEKPVMLSASFTTLYDLQSELIEIHDFDENDNEISYFGFITDDERASIEDGETVFYPNFIVEDLTGNICKDIDYISPTNIDINTLEKEYGCSILEMDISYEQDDWSPIDCAEADSGKGCFDGGTYLFLLDNGRIVTGQSFIGLLTGKHHIDLGFGLADIAATHYRPIPKGWIE